MLSPASIASFSSPGNRQSLSHGHTGAEKARWGKNCATGPAGFPSLDSMKIHPGGLAVQN